ncbi:hypothetical protein [Natrialba magadii]|uniref:hypothetical protein n=1 Tax=Natrialba magadii TaxID=13769 RepID=UPI001F4C672E|nr:hypothetical protein [Natrialba magadii]
MTVENVGENPLEYEERRSALFWFETTDDEDFILSPRDTLYDDESIFEYDTDSDHWVLDEYGSDMTSDYQVGSLEPGDTHTETLWVVTPYNANPPEETPEELRFTGEFTVSETDVNGLEEGEDESWEFTLVRKEDDQFHIAERLLVIYRGFQQSRFFTSRPVPPCSVMLRNVPHSSA